jgi:hypothetical protein
MSLMRFTFQISAYLLAGTIIHEHLYSMSHGQDTRLEGSAPVVPAGERARAGQAVGRRRVIRLPKTRIVGVDSLAC